MESVKIIPHEIAIVIVGQNHNPSILNPDFLRHHNIVPEGVSVAGPATSISTPAFSQVVYKGGLQVVSEPNRISFTEGVSGEGGVISPNAAKRYLETVPLVRYTAVGVNLTARTPHGRSPASLLAPQARGQFEGANPDAEVKLIYNLGGGRIVRLTVRREIVVALDGAKEDAVTFHGNFHRDITEAGQNESHMVASSIVDKWEEDMSAFRRLAESVAKEMKA